MKLCSELFLRLQSGLRYYIKEGLSSVQQASRAYAWNQLSKSIASSRTIYLPCSLRRSSPATELSPLPTATGICISPTTTIMCNTPILSYCCGHVEPTHRASICEPAYQIGTQCKNPTPIKIPQADRCTQCTIREEASRLAASRAQILNRCALLGATEEDMRRITPREGPLAIMDGRHFREERRGRSLRR